MHTNIDIYICTILKTLWRIFTPSLTKKFILCTCQAGAPSGRSWSYLAKIHFLNLVLPLIYIHFEIGFFRVLALNDVFWLAEVDPFWFPEFGGER